MASRICTRPQLVENGPVQEAAPSCAQGKERNAVGRNSTPEQFRHTYKSQARDRLHRRFIEGPARDQEQVRATQQRNDARQVGDAYGAQFGVVFDDALAVFREKVHFRLRELGFQEGVKRQ